MAMPPMSAWFFVTFRPVCFSRTSRTLSASAMTSGPMPSPAKTAMFLLLMGERLSGGFGLIKFQGNTGEDLQTLGQGLFGGDRRRFDERQHLEIGLDQTFFFACHGKD